MVKLLLNFPTSEPLALVKKFPYFDNLVEIHIILVGVFHLCIHDLINCIMFKEIMVELCRGQVLIHI
jgi:hypothetical protein